MTLFLLLPISAVTFLAFQQSIPIIEEISALKNGESALQAQLEITANRAAIDAEIGHRLGGPRGAATLTQESNRSLERLEELLPKIQPPETTQSTEMVNPSLHPGPQTAFLGTLRQLRAQHHVRMPDVRSLQDAVDGLADHLDNSLSAAGLTDWRIFLHSVDTLREVSHWMHALQLSETPGPVGTSSPATASELERLASEMNVQFQIFRRHLPPMPATVDTPGEAPTPLAGESALMWKSLSENMHSSEFLVASSASIRDTFDELHLAYSSHVIKMMGSRRANLIRRLQRHAAFSLLILVLCGVLGFLLFNAITRPLRELSASASALAAGRFAKLPVYRPNDEIHALNTAFHQLQTTMGRLKGEISLLQEAAAANETTLRGNPNDLQGDWRALVIGMNATVEHLHNLKSQLEGEIQLRAETEEALRQTQRLESLGQLAGGIAHDFNNLLTVIIGYADEARHIGDERYNEDLDEILNAADQAKSLIRQLMIVGRKQEIDLAPADLNQCVDSFHEIIKRSTFPKTIQIEISRASVPAFVMANDVTLNQVLLNLAMNASTAMPGGGKITIFLGKRFITSVPKKATWATPGDYWTLSFEDTGNGIPTEIKERIFDPFFTTRPNRGGSGLGLSMAWGIMHQFNGWIDVDSSESGTTFQLHFPRIDVPIEFETGETGLLPLLADATAETNDPDLPSTDADAREYIPAADGTRANVLVVEDNQRVRMFASRCLSRMGYNVIVANDGDQGLEMISKQGDDLSLILTDVLMPNCSGPDMILEAFDRDLVHCPVLFMTGYDDDQIAKLHRGTLNKKIPLMRKPFTYAQLNEFVQTA